MRPLGVMRYTLSAALLIGLVAFQNANSQTLCSAELGQFRSEVTEYSEVRNAICPVSTNPGCEHPYMPTGATKDDHVVYFASGPDIYRPLMNFPEVGHYHMFDILGGWGENPGDFLSELQSRLASLPESRVEIMSRGFTIVFPEEMMMRPIGRREPEELMADEFIRNRLMQQLVLRVQFRSRHLGLIEKYFHLHFGDFGDEARVNAFLELIPAEQKLFASFQPGLTGTPTPSSLKALLKRGNGSGVLMFDIPTEEPIAPQSLVDEVLASMGTDYEAEVVLEGYNEGWAFPYSYWLKIQEAARKP